MQSYCNTVPTPEGGTHESGLRAALTRGLKQYAELIGEIREVLVEGRNRHEGAAADLVNDPIVAALYLGHRPPAAPSVGGAA